MVSPPEDDDESGTREESPRLELAFPTKWTYTVIGEDEALLREAVRSVASPLEHVLRFSHASKTGRYLSFELIVTVPSDEVRLRLFRELGEHIHIRFLL